LPGINLKGDFINTMTLSAKQPEKIESASQSAEKLLVIMEYLAGCRMPVRLQDAAESLGMTQPTLLRYLKALMKFNYAYQDEDTLRYSLTWKVCKLGQNISGHLALRSICAPHLNKLAGTYNAGACLVIMQDYTSVYLDLADTDDTLMHSLRHIGKQAPLHSTGSGKILLSSLTDRELEGFISVMGLPKLTEHTLMDKKQLVRELNQIRKQGYAIDDEECEKGIRCVSVPLRDFQNKTVAAISVFGPADKIDCGVITDKILPHLIEVSAEISARLGYSTNEHNTPCEAV